MREAVTPLRTAFVQGIRESGDTLRNTDRLQYAKNLRPYEGGLRLQQWPEPIVNGVYVMEWPFPQLYFNSSGFYLGSKELLSQFSDSLIRYSTLSVPAGLAWSVADFGEYAFICNGVGKASIDPDTGWLETNTSTKIPIANCCCDFNRGQLILGGIQSTWYDATTNFVVWSSVGNVSCEPTKSNEAGYMPVDATGDVVAVMQLGQHIIAYATQGICSLIPIKEPATTFGQRTFDAYGIPYRTAVTGDKKNHYFVDTAGDLWRLTSNMELIKLGGRHLISPMMRTKQIVVTYHVRRDEVYISNDQYHYVRTKTGWGGPNFVPLSGAVYCLPAGRKIGGLAVVPAKQYYDAIDWAEFITDNINFARSAQKTLQWIEVECTVLGGDVFVAADYKYDTSTSWQTTDWVLLNQEGAGYLPIAGTDFRLRVRALTPTVFEIDSMRIRWKATDGRFSRGMELQIKGGNQSE